MKCPSISRLRDLLVDALAPSDAEAVSDHLEQCPRCQHALEQLTEAPLSQELDLQQDVDAARPIAAALSFRLKARLLKLRRTTAIAGEDAAKADRSTDADEAARADSLSEAPASAAADPDTGPDAQDETTAAGAPSSVDRFLIHDRLTELGRFQFRRRLGVGGFGVVYLVFDTVLKREVALKLPHAASLLDPLLKRRFLREGEATANLFHPNILPVYEAGEVEGLCYLASAYCPGPTLAQWMKKNPPLSSLAAARVIYQLAEGVQHAHQRGILHRDIKPSNVLLDPSSPLCAEFPFTPKLGDFGLAKFIDSELSGTGSNLLMGTPRYMAPEQISGTHHAGPPTDIHALGVLLYELLTGEPPVSDGDSVAALRRVLWEDVASPRKMNASISRDLEAICLKCLERAPEHRYLNADALREDLRRFLAGEPTLARPIGLLRRTWRWSRRDPTLAALIATLATAACLLVAGLSYYSARLNLLNDQLDSSLLEARQARRRATQNERRAQQLLYASDIKLAAQAWEAGDMRQFRERLERHRPPAEHEDQRGFEWRWLEQQGKMPHLRVATHADDVDAVAYSPDGRLFASGGRDGRINILASDTKQVVASHQLQGEVEVGGLAFSPDGARLAAALWDGRVLVLGVDDAEPHWSVQAHREGARHVVYAADGQFVASCGEDGRVRLWEARTGKLLDELGEHGMAIDALAVSADGAWIATGARDYAVRIWNVATRQLEATLTGHGSRVTATCFSPDGRWLASSSIDRTSRLWDLENRACVHVGRHYDGVQALAFTRDSQRLFTCDRNGAIHVWPVARDAGDQLMAWPAHRGRVYSLAVSPATGQLLSGGQDGQVRLWQAPTRPISDSDARILTRTAAAEEPALDAAFLPGSSTMALATRRGVVLWDLTSGESVRLPMPTSSDDKTFGWETVAVSGNGKWLAAGDEQGQVVLYDLQKNEPARRLDYDAGNHRLAFSADGARLAVASWTHDQVVVFDSQCGCRTLEMPANSCHLPDLAGHGRWLAIDSYDDVVLWDLNAGRRLATLHGHISTIKALAFSPDDQLLATASNDRQVKLWNVGTAAETFSLAGHRGYVQAVEFSPDGRSLVTGGTGGELKVWHVATGQELLDLPSQPADITRLAFQGESRWLAAVLANGDVVVFDLGSHP